MATAFETYINANLPYCARIIRYEDVSYGGDPNDGSAPSLVKNAPKGTFYLRNSDSSLWRKKTASAGSWEIVGASSGGITGNRLIYRENEPAPSGNVFASWSLLVTAAAAIPGLKIVEVDASLTTFGYSEIPAGTWDLGQAIICGKADSSPAYAGSMYSTEVDTPPGCKLIGVIGWQDIYVYNYTDTSAIDLTGALHRVFLRNAFIENNATGVFWNVTVGHTLFVDLYDGSKIDTTTSTEVFYWTASSGSLILSAYSGSAVGDDAFGGASGPIYSATTVDGSAEISATQTGLPTGTWNTLDNLSTASRIDYDDSASPVFGFTTVQGAIDSLKQAAGSPAYHVIINDDFMYDLGVGAGGAYTEAGSTSVIAGTNGGGMLKLDGPGIGDQAERFWTIIGTWPGSLPVVEFLNVRPSRTTNIIVDVGLKDAAMAAFTNCARFVLDTSVDTKWHCICTKSGGGTSNIDSGVVASAGDDLKIVFIGSVVNFYINGVLKATMSNAANKPTALMSPYCYHKTLVAITADTQIDRIKVEQAK